MKIANYFSRITKVLLLTALFLSTPFINNATSGETNTARQVIELKEYKCRGCWQSNYIYDDPRLNYYFCSNCGKRNGTNAPYGYIQCLQCMKNIPADDYETHLCN